MLLDYLNIPFDKSLARSILMKTLVVAPHPDDELLGCGGTLLKRLSRGYTVAWLLMSDLLSEKGWSEDRIRERSLEISQVRKRLGIAPNHFYPLKFPAAELDQIPMSCLISKVSDVFNDFQPIEVLYHTRRYS